MDMNDGQVRQSWLKRKAKQAREQKEMEQPVAVVKEEVSPQYEEYLLLLQQRNRLVSDLKEKDRLHIDLERKEKGFSLYINGANSDRVQKGKRNQSSPSENKALPSSRVLPQKPNSQRIKSSGAATARQAPGSDSGQCYNGEPMRAKTAPSRPRRKQWAVHSVDLHTARGEKQKVAAPDYLTGNYDDDFESDGVSDNDSSEENCHEAIHTMGSLAVEGSSEDDESSTSASSASCSPQKTGKLHPNRKLHEQLIMSIADVKKLRQSLEMHASIRESLAMEVSSDEEEISRASPIPEEVECEEDLAMQPLSDLDGGDKSRKTQHNFSGPALGPSDTIVLEFAPCASKERVLSSARRKVTDTRGELRPTQSVSKPAKTVNMLKSNATQQLHPGAPSHHHSSRPLSGSKKNTSISQQDSSEEASAVLQALQAENRRAVQQQKKTSSTPLARSLERTNTEKPNTEVSKKSTSVHGASDSHQSLTSMTNEKLQQILDKVVAMPSRQQKQLVQMLGRIEQSLLGNKNSGKSVNKQTTSSSEKSHKKSIANTHNEIVPPSTQVTVKHSTTVQLDKRDAVSKDKRNTNQNNPGDVINVTFELLSSWGGSDRIGMTEMQIYDQDNQLIPVRTSNIFISGATESETAGAEVLFNGKCKTTKERNMWVCKLGRKDNVEVMVTLTNPHPGRHFALSKIRIWNYNKSINDLSLGVKHIRIYKDDLLIFDGEIDKGCGNQIFDYSKVISIGANNYIDKNDYVNNDTDTCRVGDESLNNAEQIFRDTGSHEKHAYSLSKNNINSDCDKKPHRILSSPQRDRALFHGTPSPILGESHHTFHSVTRSSQSSASSLERVSGGAGESCDSSRETSRCETRTMDHSSDMGLSRPVIISELSSPEVEANDQELKHHHHPSHGSHSPRLSQRMAANLGSHTSDSEKSASHNSNKDSLGARQLPWKSSEKPYPSITEPTPSKGIAQRSSQQKWAEESQNSLPNWLKAEAGKASSFEPAESTTVTKPRSARDLTKDDILEDFIDTRLQDSQAAKPSPRGSGQKSGRRQQKSASDRNGNSSNRTFGNEKSDDDHFDVIVDGENEERVRKPRSRNNVLDLSTNWGWSPVGSDHLSTVFDARSKSPQEESASNSPEVDDDTVTPMQRIQKNRSKWRDNQQKKLEESWGSLSLFNMSHRGRLSIDLGDDVLDECANVKKPSPVPEEDTPISKPTVEQDKKRLQPTHQLSKSEDDSDEDFIIPELPHGRQLEISIRSTWGDSHYVGLTGVELFSSTGEAVKIKKISADPADINVLPDYDKDPRVVSNLIDGVHRTRDDVHMWLAPFNKDRKHTVSMTFERPCQVAMMRVWNYNKSRIHSYRGARNIEVSLDGQFIFKGEISRACGGIEGGTEAFGDTILFTTDELMLEAVSHHDSAYEAEVLSDDDWEEDIPFERPATADNGKEDRPFTRASGLTNSKQQPSTKEEVSTHQQAADPVKVDGDVTVYRGQTLELNFTSTWGDPYYMGLTGLEVVGKDGEALPVTMKMLTASPHDVCGLKGHEDDDRTLDKLIDGTNITMNDEHMWLIPFTEGESHVLLIDFGQKVLMAGLRLWNYNKSPEDTYRGAKTVHAKIDGRSISPGGDGYLVRKGPGVCHFDFAQEISFAPQHSNNNPGSKIQHSPENAPDVPSQEYEAIQMPCGFIYQLHLLSTWGDPYYIGLNGIEFYDDDFNKITLTDNNIAAYPDSVNVLDNVNNDVRTPDKLIDSVNDTIDGRHMWLAPVLPTIVNRVYVIFDQPTTLSMIKVWNYSKTPQRGTRDFALLVDDLLVYNGTLRGVAQTARGILPTCSGSQGYHTILFTTNKKVLQREKHTVISNQTGEQDIQLTNDKTVVASKKTQSAKPVNQAMTLPFLPKDCPVCACVGVDFKLKPEFPEAKFQGDYTALRPKTSVTDANKRRR